MDGCDTQKLRESNIYKNLNDRYFYSILRKNSNDFLFNSLIFEWIVLATDDDTDLLFVVVLVLVSPCSNGSWCWTLI